ncbi:uncharacterized protein EV420DRAFT_113771 [Desarmillaria tabescens]|uniref:Uncharacterized protein n=1 Tax=Armillaria tabescens TaxID=1929756 RepID=A0AA39NRC5_ARMTA|nr:uncharacterized protein EV420DRAFT_113771 [Desarmillaria tabescens]KAK0470410.1 hypothetical protein EV420DRAFT_113771 [Desarmillaria tabescens]
MSGTFVNRALDGYLNALALESLMHGLFTAITLSALVNILKHKHLRVMIPLVLILYILETIHLGARWYWVRQAFIVHGATRETIFSSFLDERYRHIWIVSGLSASINIVIADCTRAWRAWVIWDRNWKIATVPIVGIVLEIIFDGLFLSQDLSHTSNVQYTNWGFSAIRWGLGYFILSLLTTFLCTFLIIYRIGCNDKYLNIIEMLVESAALYSVSMIVFIVFFARDDPRNVYAQAVMNSITGIAPTLIAERVAAKRNYLDENTITMRASEKRLSNASTTRASSLEFDSARSGAPSRMSGATII